MRAWVKWVAHLWQVLRHEAYPNLGTMNWKQLADFTFMRFVMPLGWGAASRNRRLSSLPALGPLAFEGVMILEPVESDQLYKIRTFLDEKIANKHSGSTRCVAEWAKVLIARGATTGHPLFLNGRTGVSTCEAGTIRVFPRTSL